MEGWKYELTTAESAWMNQQRMICFQTRAIWWNATTGEQLTNEELSQPGGFQGPTFCPHQWAGMPCLSPRPIPGASDFLFAVYDRGSPRHLPPGFDDSMFAGLFKEHNTDTTLLRTRLSAPPSPALLAPLTPIWREAKASRWTVKKKLVFEWDDKQLERRAAERIALAEMGPLSEDYEMTESDVGSSLKA